LLDALEALGAHRDSIVVVGAQAVYLRTGGADLAVAEFTTDADLAIDPGALRPDPRLDAALAAVEEAVAGLADPAFVRTSLRALVSELLAAVG
jgi:hypothetical protein